MKKIYLVISMIVLVLTSCNDTEYQKAEFERSVRYAVEDSLIARIAEFKQSQLAKPFDVIITSNTYLKATHVYCDSFQMVSTKQIYVYIGKLKQRIIANEISVSDNTEFIR